MKFYDVEQNSDEWLSLRRGKFTASSFKDLFMKETTQGYQDAIYKVIFERLTGESPESFTSDWMQRGHELEQEAREWYELETYNKVHNGGFFEYNDWTGASPDGLVGNNGLVEIKCPKYSTMIDYLLKKELPKIYYYQVHGQLLVTDRKWCDFVAYHPALPKIILRIERDSNVDKEILVKLLKATEEAMQIIDRLK
ncbi:MAG: YqaJ viral recombinase family protein [Ignavibacteriales bacterium]|nr:YqaJ viral recombinase family protein [Ignavibacteriales bacterium]